MNTLRERYFRGSKKEKGEILNEYCRNTGENRKYAIKKFRYKVRIKRKEERRKRKEMYDGRVKAVLVELWKIFDFPCGQRLSPLIERETDRLIRLREIHCDEKMAIKVKAISSATIDRKLRHEKRVLLVERKNIKKYPLLNNQIPVKTSDEFDRTKIGFTQADFVEHCGSTTAGEYLNSLCLTEIYSGWWEGEAVMGKGQERAFAALKSIRERQPFVLKGIHPDNQNNLLNYQVLEYIVRENIEFSRSRPYRKNDNCFVEQQNFTHVRDVVGYLRHDTEQELGIIRDLYRNELRLYKNFFQPIIRLKEKVRVGGKIHKKYGKAKTPYERLMESDQISMEKKKELADVYESLNPAELKRKIDAKLKELYLAYQKKNGSRLVAADKRLTPSMVSLKMMQFK